MTVRVALWAAMAVALSLIAIPRTEAAPVGEAVVVSTTAPNIRQGQLVRAGEWLDAPPGAVVTLMDASGRLVTLQGRSRYEPTETSSAAAREGDARRVLSAVAALVRTDRTEVEMIAFRNTGGPGCPTGSVAAPLFDLEGLLAQDCQWAAREAIAAAAAAAAPAHLHLGGVRALRVQGRPMAMAEFTAQANFDATIRCTVETDGAAAGVTLGPEGAASQTLIANAPLVIRGRPLFQGPPPKIAQLVCVAEEAPGAARAGGRKAEARAALAGP